MNGSGLEELFLLVLRRFADVQFRHHGSSLDIPHAALAVVAGGNAMRRVMRCEERDGRCANGLPVAVSIDGETFAVRVDGLTVAENVFIFGDVSFHVEENQVGSSAVTQNVVFRVYVATTRKEPVWRGWETVMVSHLKNDPDLETTA